MTTAAPKSLHDILDYLAPAINVGKSLGMGTQLILYIDKDGNAGTPKVSMSGNGKGEKP